MMRRELQYSIGTFVGLALLVVGLFGSSSVLLSAIGFFIILAISTRELVDLWPVHLRGTEYTLGLILSLSFLMIGGSLVYYSTQVTTVSLFFVMAALPFVSWFLRKRFSQTTQDTIQESFTPKLTSGVYASLIVIALLIFFTTITNIQTIEAIRSPWLVAPTRLLLWIGVSVVSLLFLARHKLPKLAIVGSTGVLFAMVSIAYFVFPLGYGFDPFNHQATVNHIFLNGTITPTLFQYVGQYALELITMAATGLSSPAIDTLLLPLLSALLIPTVVASAMWQITRKHLPTALSAIAVLLFPLGFFVNTTPQGLANLWTLVVLFLAAPELMTGIKWTPAWVIVLLALTTFLIHPLAGIPVSLFVFFFLVQTTNVPSNVRNGLNLLGLFGGTLALPAIFFARGIANFSFDIAKIGSLIPRSFLSTNSHALGDLVAWIGVNGWIWILLAAAGGVFALKKTTNTSWRVYLFTASSLLLSACTMAATSQFGDLIEYEQANYASRIALLAFYSVLPFAVYGFIVFCEKLWNKKNATLTIASLLIIAVAVPTNAYMTYPRHDDYTVSRSFNVSASDHDTVSSIASHAEGSPYIVLANQNVSAAALRDHGYLHYYGEDNNLFYYPIPTSSPLYGIFLEMIEENPTTDLALDAMNLADVDLLYFVVNDYWWSAELAIERARAQTDDYFSVNDGDTWVFVYRR